ncbi:MAG TPA: hypothetical protein VGP69_05915 [Gaiellaceae bacterium]|jgi:hypothetical protein|nr:hypothetical protein [Gaiellaceae bacterium]
MASKIPSHDKNSQLEALRPGHTADVPDPAAAKDTLNEGFAPPLVQKGASHRRATSGLNDEANRNGRLLSDFNPKIRP